jgi:hypothetical protein
MAIELGTFPELKASVRFRFNEPSVSDLSFPLPSWIGNPDKEDAFEIRGVRGAKFSSGQRQEPEFTFTLDRPLSRDVFVNVEFDFADPISSGVFRKSLSHGRTLSRQLVFTEEDPA